MPPFTQTLHVLHEHEALLMIVLIAGVAFAFAVWIAVANYHEGCARPGSRRGPCRPPNDRRTRR